MATPTKKLIAFRLIRDRNTKHMKRLLANVVSKMLLQGTGCFIKGYGVAYIDRTTQRRDPIGLLLGYADLKNMWGPISGEFQKPLVDKLSRMYGVDFRYDSEYSRFVEFLDEIQSAHDDVYNEFNNTGFEYPMIEFLSRCDEVKTRFKLQERTEA